MSEIEMDKLKKKMRIYDSAWTCIDLFTCLKTRLDLKLGGKAEET